MIETQLSLFDKETGKYVRRISYDETKPFLLGIHYARRMPCITDAFGLFLDRQMIGVVTYGIPASRPLCIGVAGVENADKVKELNRLCILPEYNGKNYASYLVSQSLKMLPNGTFVVSYADTAWTHVGYIYQATNFLYTGLTAKRNDTYQPGGAHPRAYDKENHSELLQSRSRKHRYIYLVGNKTTKRKMRKQLKYKVYDHYPKGNETRYNVDNPEPKEKIRIVERKRALNGGG